jgi:hypothetical protein
MAKTWSDVAQSDQFQSLSPDQQSAARDQYFAQVVAPKVPKEHLDAAKSQFDEASSKSMKEPGALAAAGRAVKGAVEGAAHVAGSALASGIEGEVGDKSMAAQLDSHFVSKEAQQKISDRVKQAEAGISYTPKSEVGKDIAHITDLPGNISSKIGDYVTNKTGSKDLGTRAEAAANLGMMFVGPKGAKIAADSAVAGVNHVNDIAQAAIEQHGPKALADLIDGMAETPMNQKGPAGAKLKAAADKLRNMTTEEAKTQINNGNSSVHQAISAMRSQAGNMTRSTKANLVDTLNDMYNITPGQGAGAIAKAVGKGVAQVGKAGVSGGAEGAASGAKLGSGYKIAKSMIDKAFPEMPEAQKRGATLAVQGVLGVAMPVVGHAELAGGVIGAVWQGVKQAAQQVPKSWTKAGKDIKTAVGKVAVGKLLEDQPQVAGKPTLGQALQPKSSAVAPGASPSAPLPQQVPQQAPAQPTAPGASNVMSLGDAINGNRPLATPTPKTGPTQVVKFDDLKNGSNVKVEKNYDGGFTAKVPGDKRAVVMFKPDGKGVDVSDIFRGEQKKGSAGDMVATSIQKAGIANPEHVKVSGILDNQPTLKQLSDGKAPEDTTLGKTIVSAVKKMGGKVTGWEVGVDQKHGIDTHPYIKANVSYDD